ncbi:APC family amino acid-polyamine-organocation transporter, antiporter [Staphylococcus aureus]|nr:APC family amino acid-polyamine-organocation transporter, antiporter [Staphylococcus aureus]
MENTINESEKKKRFKLKMPGAFMILFILTVVAVITSLNELDAALEGKVGTVIKK